jgi:hypothetical protein
LRLSGIARHRAGGLTIFSALLFLSLVTPHGNLFSQSNNEAELPLRPERVSADFTKKVAGFSAGIFLGQPLGLSVKYSWERRLALEGAFGYSLLGNTSGLTLHSSLIYHLEGARLTNGHYLRPYIGGGAALFFVEELEAALRIPLGLNFYLGVLPIEIAVEGATGMVLFPEVRAYVAGGIILRYRFTSPLSSSEASSEEQEKR